MKLKLPHKAEDRNKIIGPFIGLAMSVLFIALFASGALDTIGNLDLDAKFKVRQRFEKPPVNRDIHNVLIDDSTLDWEGAYPDDPIYYVDVINGLGLDKHGALATLFAIDYSRPFGRKVDIDVREGFSGAIEQISQILFYNLELKFGMMEKIGTYRDFLDDPEAPSYAADLAPRFEEIVFDEELGSVSGLMEQVAGFAGHNMHLNELAPDREKAVGRAAASARNVYFAFSAKNYLPTPHEPKDLKLDKNTRAVFERVLSYPTRNKPDNPAEALVFDAYQNLDLRGFDFLLEGEGEPFGSAVAKRIAEDRKRKSEELYHFHKQNSPPMSAKVLKTDAYARSLFEKAMKSDPPPAPPSMEALALEAYQSLSASDLDYLMGKEGTPFDDAINDRLLKDKVLRMAGAEQNEEETAATEKEFYVFDIPPGLENAFPKLNKVNPVQPEIGMNTAGQGPQRAEFSRRDGTLRMIAPVYSYENKLYPHVDFLIALKYLKVKPEDVLLKRNKIILKNATLPGAKGGTEDITIPLLPGGKMLVNWAGIWADTTLFDTDSFLNFYSTLGRHSILERGRANAKIPPEEQTDPLQEDEAKIYESIVKTGEAATLDEKIKALKDKIIIIGLTAEGTADMNPTPLEPRYKILGLHANAINTIVERLFIDKAPFIWVALIFVVLGAGLGFSGGAVRHTNPFLVAVINFSIMLFVAAAYFAAANYLFIAKRIEIPVFAAIGLIAATFLSVFIYRFLTEEKEKKKMKGMFSTYVNPQVVDSLLADPDKLKLGGERTRASVFFSDVAGFTSISEALTPEELVELLNEYLTEMTAILMQYGGTLDKYIGDAIVGIFGAPIPFPDHAKNVCYNALDMQAKIAEMREAWKTQGKHLLQVRCGANTGEMIAGNMGSTNRFCYTVIGPEVDFGEHMESSGKLYSTQTTISEFTRAEADEFIIVRFLDIQISSAYKNPVKIYELLAKKSDGLPDIKLECCDLHEDSVLFYFQRRFDEAAEKAARIFDIFPEKPVGDATSALTAAAKQAVDLYRQGKYKESAKLMSKSINSKVYPPERLEEETVKFLHPTCMQFVRIAEAKADPPDASFDAILAEATHRKDLKF